MQSKYQVQDTSPGAETSCDYVYRLGSERLVGAQKNTQGRLRDCNCSSFYGAFIAMLALLTDTLFLWELHTSSKS